LGSLPGGYIAPPELRELRELVRHRRQLVKACTSVKNGIRGLLAKHGIRLTVTHLEAATGQGLLDRVELPAVYALRLDSQRRLLMLLTNEIDALDVEIDRRLKTHPGYRNLLTVKGIEPVLAAVFVVEIGDVSRFSTPAQLACWAGLTPRHYESDRTVRRGQISKEGSSLVRWAASEAIQRQCQPQVQAVKDDIGARRGKTAATSPRSPPRTACSTWCSTSCTTGTPRCSTRPRKRHEPARPASRGPAIGMSLPPGSGRLK
jgi:transposase